MIWSAEGSGSEGFGEGMRGCDPTARRFRANAASLTINHCTEHEGSGHSLGGWGVWPPLHLIQWPAQGCCPTDATGSRGISGCAALPHLLSALFPAPETPPAPRRPVAHPPVQPAHAHSFVLQASPWPAPSHPTAALTLCENGAASTNRSDHAQCLHSRVGSGTLFKILSLVFNLFTNTNALCKLNLFVDYLGILRKEILLFDLIKKNVNHALDVTHTNFHTT